MLILRNKNFSCKTMINRITSKLEKLGLDYDVSSRIPIDSISITMDLNDLKIYIPTDNEYAQYGIDDFIREMVPYIRTNTVLDRNIYVMKLSGKLNEDQLFKLVKHVIEEEDFCTLIDTNN